MLLNPIIWIDDDPEYALMASRLLQGKGVPNPLVSVEPDLAFAFLSELRLDLETAEFPCAFVIAVRAQLNASLSLLTWLRAIDRFVVVPLLLVLTPDGEIPKSTNVGIYSGRRISVEKSVAMLAARLIQDWAEENRASGEG